VKIEGVFLDSRLARRIFSLFVLAVTVPIVLLSVLAYSGWTSYAATQEQQRLTQSTRYFALTVFDRLMAAQSALRMAAPQPADARLHGIFRSVSVEPADASVVPPPQAQRLSWRRPSRDEAPARVTLRVHDPATGLVRIGELAPDYLWSEAFDDAGGEQVCVFAEAGEPIFCSSNAQRAVDEARAGNVVSASWKLFLRHEFGVDDWRFTIQREHAALSGFSWLHIGWQVVAASVLLVITLSLVLVRRTTVPLQKLTAGTRRLAAGDYAARVDVRSADEFGELGAAFNHMARRIGRQVHQLEVLSAIDREILEAGDAQRLVSRTLERLAELSPGAIVGIGLVDPGAPERLACSLRAADGGTDSRELVLTPELQTVLLALPVGRWWSRAQAQSAAAAPLFSALGWRPQACYTAPACWRGQTLAVLLVGEGHAAPHEAWVRRVGELRDRIAVALASAARERQLQHRATHDSLTGMLNRAGLHDVLADAIEAGRRFTLLWIDLDRFKEVNDTLGHAAGDELLATIAQRVVQCVPHGTAVARLGGDEFVALVPDADDAHIDDIAAALVALVARPVMLRGMQIATGASLGIAAFPRDGRSVVDLLRHADMAMYAAKSRGRAQVVRFEAALGNAAEQHASLSRELARAVERDELRLHYQPRIDARTGRIRSVEALVRWQHPARGLLLPGAFIDLAEESGLVVPIGRWVLGEACRQMAAWRRAGLPLKSVAVNLSAHQLRTPALVEEVFDALRHHGLASTELELEVTESVLVGDVQATSHVLARLRAAGVRIAIDDFGTGYSSMAYLRYLPVDVLKIDRAFVKDIGSDASADIVVRAIVGLAGSLGLGTVAEGVETAQQARLLIEMGCDELQGFHFVRPLPAQAVPDTLCPRRDETAPIAG